MKTKLILFSVLCALVVKCLSQTAERQALINNFVPRESVAGFEWPDKLYQNKWTRVLRKGSGCNT